MSGEQHTSGPWSANNSELSAGGTIGIAQSTTRKAVCDVFYRTTGEHLVNARLIATAPEAVALARHILANDAGKFESETDAQWHDRLSEILAEQHSMAQAIVARVDGGAET